MHNDDKPARRKLLRSLTILGGGSLLLGKLPTHWNPPVVNAVILPAHATTTTCEGYFCGSIEGVSGYVQIRANGDGTVTITDFGNGNSQTTVAYDNAGYFSTTFPGLDLIIEGTIINCTSISGRVCTTFECTTVVATFALAPQFCNGP